MQSEDIAASLASMQKQPSDCNISSFSGRATDNHSVSADAILTTLHAIARESEAVDSANRVLLIARATERTTVDTMTTRQLSHSCNLLTSRVATLQKLVVAFDEDIAGNEIGSFAELGVRAQTLAILLLLDELCDVVSRDPLTYQELFTGQLRTLEDVVWQLFNSLARINKLWLRHRAKPHAPTGGFALRVFDTTRPRLYRSAIRRAQRAIAELGAEPDLAHFLQVGSSRTDAPRVCRACDQLTDVLGVALTREPDPALFLAAAVLEPEELHDLPDDDDTTS